MKKMLTLVVAAVLCTTVVQAQSQERLSKKETAPTIKATSTQITKTEGRENLKAGTPVQQEADKASVRQEDIERGIADIERVMKENEGKEGFQKEAYQKRLDYLKSKRTSTPTSPNTEK